MKKLVVISVVVAFSACTHKALLVTTASPVTPTGCDTTNVTYHADVQPVLGANCYSCHGTAQVASGGGLDLQNFASLKNYLQYGFRGDGIYGSKLYHCILHSQLALPMPPTYTVDSCSQRKIKRWLDEGAPGN